MSVSGSSYSSDNNLGGKRCSDCGIVKDADAFYRHQYTPDGLGYKCKECISIKNKTNYHTRKDQNGSNDALYIFEHPLIPGLIKIGQSDCPPSIMKQNWMNEICLECVPAIKSWSLYSTRFDSSGKHANAEFFIECQRTNFFTLTAKRKRDRGLAGS